MSLLDQYVAHGFLSQAVAQSLKRYGAGKQEEAVQAAAVAMLQKLDPLAAARRAVEPEFSSEKMNEISAFYRQLAAAGEEQDGVAALAETKAIADGLGVGRRRAQQILQITLARIQDKHQLPLFAAGGSL
ncbi:MAG: hypothetical protein M0Z85_06735 [Gammaproteobacteria bacterium]|nr:hypothetical protein [Gammaproteobacteria bacterium]